MGHSLLFAGITLDAGQAERAKAEQRGELGTHCNNPVRDAAEAVSCGGIPDLFSIQEDLKTDQMWGVRK